MKSMPEPQTKQGLETALERAKADGCFEEMERLLNVLRRFEEKAA